MGRPLHPLRIAATNMASFLQKHSRKGLSLMKIFRLAPFCLALLTTPTLVAQVAAAPTVAARLLGAERPATHFAGDWTGQLEYRDYQSDKQVVLPTRLTATSSSDGRLLRLAFTYDDGRGKTVHSTETLTFFPQAKMASLSTDGEHTSNTYAMAGFDDFTATNLGTLTLTGAGTDNNQPADVRITITLTPDSFTWRKETRPKGSTDALQLRDAYTFHRAPVTN